MVGECPSEQLVPAFLQLALSMCWGPWEKTAGIGNMSREWICVSGAPSLDWAPC